MASAYATLAAGGTYREPKLVEEVGDRSGRVLERGPARGRQAISAHEAAEATRILEGVVSRGTGRRADIGDGVAGKTGKTQDHRDAWPAPDDNQSAVHTRVVPAADLGIGIIKGPCAIRVGEDVAYELEVTNHGPSRAKRVSVIFATPPALRFAGASGASRYRSSKGQVGCTAGTLEPGSTRPMRLRFESYSPAMVEVEVAAGAPEIDPQSGQQQDHHHHEHRRAAGRRITAGPLPAFDGGLQCAWGHCGRCGRALSG